MVLRSCLKEVHVEVDHFIVQPYRVLQALDLGCRHLNVEMIRHHKVCSRGQNHIDIRLLIVARSTVLPSCTVVNAYNVDYEEAADGDDGTDVGDDEEIDREEQEQDEDDDEEEKDDDEEFEMKGKMSMTGIIR